MLKFKIDVLSKLKEKGYNTTRLRKEKLIGENALTNIRKGVVPGIKTINAICALLDMQPGSIIRYVPDTPPEKIHDEKEDIPDFPAGMDLF